MSKLKVLADRLGVVLLNKFNNRDIGNHSYP